MSATRGSFGPTSYEHAHRELRGSSFGVVVALLVQFVAGMLLNLFVDVPTNHAGAQPSEYFAGSFQSVLWAITSSGIPLLIFHAVWGLLLVLASIRVIFVARALRQRGSLVLAVLGFLFTLGAGFNGASFLDFNEDASSMIMAGLFALAVLCYGAILYRLAAES